MFRIRSRVVRTQLFVCEKMCQCPRCDTNVDRDHKYCGCGFQLLCDHKGTQAALFQRGVQKPGYRWVKGDTVCRFCGVIAPNLELIFLFGFCALLCCLATVFIGGVAFVNDRKEWHAWVAASVVAGSVAGACYIKVVLEAAMSSKTATQDRLESKVRSIAEDVRAILGKMEDRNSNRAILEKMEDRNSK